MKKRSRIFAFLLIAIILISINFVSADRTDVNSCARTNLIEGTTCRNLGLDTAKCICKSPVDGINTPCNNCVACDDVEGVGAYYCYYSDTSCNAYSTCCTKRNYYRDGDADGYGNPLIVKSACTQPLWHVSNNLDCNDANAAVNPSKTEICNGIDDNCNGVVDENVCSNCVDADSDGYDNCDTGGDGKTIDCNDGNVAIYPSKTESCNDVDDNCDGVADDGGVCYGNRKVDPREYCDDSNTNNDDCCKSPGIIKEGCVCSGSPSSPSVCCENQCTLGETGVYCNKNEGIDQYLELTCIKNDEFGGCYMWDWEDFYEGTCDEGEICASYEENGVGQCIAVEDEMPVMLCDDYEDQTACNKDDYKVCEYTVNQYLMDFAIKKGSYILEDVPENFCSGDFPIYSKQEDIDPAYASCSYYASNCQCNWLNGNCSHKYVETRECELVDTGLIEESQGNCVFSTTSFQDNCDTTGYIKYSRDATWTPIDPSYTQGQSACQDYSKEYKCADIAKLPFFGLREFFLSSIFICLSYILYFFFSNRR